MTVSMAAVIATVTHTDCLVGGQWPRPITAQDGTGTGTGVSFEGHAKIKGKSCLKFPSWGGGTWQEDKERVITVQDI
jgi:hypothetical protein